MGQGPILVGNPYLSASTHFWKWSIDYTGNIEVDHAVHEIQRFLIC